MGRIVVTEFISLDGVIEDPGGAEGYEHGGWSFQFNRGAAGDRFKHDELAAAEAMLLGRVTYDAFAAAWPNIEDDQGFADLMNGTAKYVVSKTLRSADWNNSTILSGDAVEEITALKERIAGDILVHGSAALCRLMAAHDLVDEYRLMVFPVLLGHGKKLFADDAAKRNLEVGEVSRAGDAVTMVLHPSR